MKVLLLWVIASCVGLSGQASAARPQSSDAKQLWQLLDYVAVDYNGAVQGNRVVSDGEYAEMLDFTGNALQQAHDLPETPAKARLIKRIEVLRAAVIAKADALQVAGIAHEANALLIGAYPMPVAPQSPPDLARGAALFQQNCASCHGSAGGGDGPAAASLNPKPVAFTERERARARSVMALFHVISQGVPGTSMVSFSALLEQDRWALAFFAGTLSHGDAMRERGQRLWEADAAVKSQFPDLAAVTTVTEDAAAAQLSTDAARDAIAYLRAHPEVTVTKQPEDLSLARQRLKESLTALQAGDRAGATKLALSAYLDGFEPLEPTIGARNKALLIAVESAMLTYRSTVSNGTTAEALAAAGKLDTLFAQVDDELEGGKSSAMTTFIGAMTILLREGVEALLIVIGIAAFLIKAKRHDVLRYVHAGWVSALVLGVLTWVVATHLVAISGASREVTEGVGSVLAAIVLLSVGLWMHQKSSAGRWHAYLKEKLTTAMSRRSAWALFLLAFVAVYREVFETVLFYSALAAEGNSQALVAGFTAAAALLAVIAWILLKTSARMPIGRFFSITSILVAVLAVILIGKGVAALQEAGWIGVHPVWAPRIEVLGVMPTAETLLTQLIVLILAVSGFGLNLFWARKPHTI